MNCYKINEINKHKYYQVPKALCSVERYKTTLNSDAKMLYALLLDRMELSRSNGWIESDGTIFLIYTREQLAEMLGLCVKTITKAFKMLKSVDLIAEKRQGRGLPNLIYVGKIDYSTSADKNVVPTETKKIRVKCGAKEQSKSEKSSHIDTNFFPANETDFTLPETNYPNQVDTDSFKNKAGKKNTELLNSS